jgi:hypothetical protein
MRQGISLICVLALMSGACNATDEGIVTDSVTSSISLAAGSSRWSAVEVDSVAVTGQIPTVVVGEDGRTAVAYLREVRPGVLEVVWSSCVDAACTAMTHSVLGSGPFWLTWGSSAALTTDGVVVSGDAASEEGIRSVMLWTCSDTDCQSPVETPIGNSALGSYAIPGQMPVIGYSVWSGVADYEMYIGFCDDAACTSHRPVPVYQGQGGWGSTELQALPDGSPVLFFTTGGDPDQPEQWTVAVCSDPDCSEALIHEEDPSWSTNDTSLGSGLPSIVYFRGPEIHRLQCLDAACSTLADRLVHAATDAAILGNVVATATNDTLFVLYQSFTQWPEEESYEWELNLLRCDKETCQLIDGVPFTTGFHISIGHGVENAVVVAVQTGRPYLCLDECADPTEDLSKLTLYFADLSNE